MFQVDPSKLYPSRQQALPKVAGQKDVAGFQQVMMVLLPGAVAQGDSRKPHGDRGEVAKKRDVDVADLRLTAQLRPECRFGLLQQLLFIELHIGRNAYPGKQKQAQNCACYAYRVSFELFQSNIYRDGR